MSEDTSLGWRIFKVVNYIVLGAMALLAVIPLFHFFAVSLSDRAATMGGLVTFFPIRPTLASYELVMQAPNFFKSLVVSLERVVLGTILSMAVTILTAYPLSKTRKVFRGRNLLMWLLLIGFFTDWGLIPWWLTIKNLGLMYTIWALIIPPAMMPYNIIIMMNFFRDIPSELEDAARIDGASHWRRLLSIYMPLSMPAIATLTLFTIVFHWNSWFDGMVLTKDISQQPLQTFLRGVVIGADLAGLGLAPETAQFVNYSERSIRAASVFLAIVPVLLLYPLVQRYFVAGARLGSVKG
jgi:putative aldouronate transport system permease protein